VDEFALGTMEYYSPANSSSCSPGAPSSASYSPGGYTSGEVESAVSNSALERLARKLLELQDGTAASNVVVAQDEDIELNCLVNSIIEE
jgi:hypothetical protein